jgi:carboxymethylenebutenolidase
MATEQTNDTGSGRMVEFPSNGTTGSGYFAPAAGGSGPAVLVIQEWWGLVPHIRDVVDRFAAAGFSALAPDLYRGATTTEPDEAGKLMMSLNLEQASKDLRGAIAFLKGADEVDSSGVGVVGFCMGGGLAMMVAAREPDDVVACVPFYGLIPWEGAEPDWARLAAPVRGHFAELDGFFGPDKAAELEQRLQDLGKDARITVHPGVDHAFFNDDRPEVYDATAAGLAWQETVDFLRATVR